MAISSKILICLVALVLMYSIGDISAISWGGDGAWIGKRETQNNQESKQITVGALYYFIRVGNVSRNSEKWK